jgi:hypothetical protein
MSDAWSGGSHSAAAVSSFLAAVLTEIYTYVTSVLAKEY